MLVEADDLVREGIGDRVWHAARLDRKRSGDRCAIYVCGKCTSPRTGRPTNADLHREILGARPWEQVDHRNHDTLDNRRANLRACDNSQNQQNRPRAQRNNRSGVKGVHLEVQRPGAEPTTPGSRTMGSRCSSAPSTRWRRSPSAAEMPSCASSASGPLSV